MRYEVLDSWRGICALAIALLHFDALHHAWHAPLLRNAYLFVDFFFVLSGFVISHAYADRIASPVDALRFMVRRFGRIWPLHAAMLLAYLAVETAKWFAGAQLGVASNLGAFEPGGRVDVATLPSQLMLTQGLGIHDGLTWNLPSWSISAEFWTYAVFALISLAGASMRTVGLVAIAAAALWTLAVYSPDAMYAAHDLGFARALLGFGFGHLAWRLRRRTSFAPFGPPSIVEFAAIVLVVAFVWIAGKDAISFAAPVVFATAVYVFSFERGAVSGLLLATPFRKLGLWSYSIYMTHDFVMYVGALSVSALQRRLGHDVWLMVNDNGEPLRIIAIENRWILDVAAVGYLVVVICLASLTFRHIEEPARLAFNRFADRLGSKRSAPAGTRS